MDDAEALGEGPIRTAAQERREAARNYGLRPDAAPAAVSGAPVRHPSAPDLSTTIVGARQDGGGDWIMTTAEGAVWLQTDKGLFSRPPHAGSKFAVRRGAMGSYFCLVDGVREVRCKRKS